MRSFLIVALAAVAVLLVPVSQFVKAQMDPPQGEQFEFCHISDKTAGTGKVISIALNAAALNAHLMLHGDCLAADVVAQGSGPDTCECEPLTEPMGDDEGDDDDDDDDDTGDDDDA